MPSKASTVGRAGINTLAKPSYPARRVPTTCRVAEATTTSNADIVYMKAID